MSYYVQIVTISESVCQCRSLRSQEWWLVYQASNHAVNTAHSLPSSSTRLSAVSRPLHQVRSWPADKTVRELVICIAHHLQQNGMEAFVVVITPRVLRWCTYGNVCPVNTAEDTRKATRTSQFCRLVQCGHCI